MFVDGESFGAEGEISMVSLSVDGDFFVFFLFVDFELWDA